jgi:hypothetical protein
LYDGRLGEFPADEDSAIIDPATTLAGAARAYRLTVRVDDADSVQGLDWSGQAFRFGAEPAEPIARPQARKVPVDPRPRQPRPRRRPRVPRAARRPRPRRPH